MKFNEITENASAGSTGSGSISTVASPMSMQSRNNASIYGGKKAGNLLTGKKSKGKYANSVEARKHMNKVNEVKVAEAEVLEQEVLVIPGAKRKDRKTGFVPQGESRVDHEVKMAKADLFATAKNAKEIMECLKDRSEEEGIKGWMQSYITLANDYLNSVNESLQYEMQMHEDQLAAYGNGADDRINTRNKLDKEPYGGPSSSYPGG